MAKKQEISYMTAEPILLAMIEENSRLPQKKHVRYWQLRDKQEEEVLTESESDEYEALIREWEARNVERVRALIALAKKHGTNLRGVMKQLVLKGSENRYKQTK